jgi:hypothetical protein
MDPSQADITRPRGSRLGRSVADEERGLRVTLAGVIDEHAQRAALADQLQTRLSDRTLVERSGGAPRVTFDLAGVERLTSAGVREWILFMRAVPQNGQYAWDPGAPVMIRQANAIVGFLGGARVTSLLYPFYCPSCEHELDEPVAVGLGATRRSIVVPRVSCPRCRATMEAAEDPSQYLGFLGG